MGRRPCCAKVGMNRGAWSSMEDEILTSYIKAHGEGNWRDLPQKAGLKRCGKSCRLRWLNYLKPDIKRGNITEDEEEMIIKMHSLLGNRWSLIAGRIPGRTDNEIKNYWNTTLRKKIKKTHQPKEKDTTNDVDDERKMTEHSESQTKPYEVIRTKAVRITKVVIPKELGLIPSPMVNDHNNNENYESPSFSTTTDDSDFLMDFDINELLNPDMEALDFGRVSLDEEEGDESLQDIDEYSCLPRFEARGEDDKEKLTHEELWRLTYDFSENASVEALVSSLF